VDWWVVRRRALSDYYLKVVDFAWVCASAIELVFLLLAARESLLVDRINVAEARSATIREAYYNKMRTGTDECMAGTWPPGAVKGKSYTENGNFVTEACTGVSAALDFFGRFFDDTPLWRYPASLETAEKFSAAYEQVFVGDFNHLFETGWAKPRAIDALTVKAKNEFAAAAQAIVANKQFAGRAQLEKELVHDVAAVGMYWPLVAATALAFSIGKARVELREAKDQEHRRRRRRVKSRP
jgi:hypothetical protein